MDMVLEIGDELALLVSGGKVLLCERRKPGEGPPFLGNQIGVLSAEQVSALVHHLQYWGVEPESRLAARRRSPKAIWYDY
jgi:hypothetical protein